MSKLNIKAIGRNFLKKVVGDVSCEKQLGKKMFALRTTLNCSLNNVTKPVESQHICAVKYIFIKFSFSSTKTCPLLFRFRDRLLY